VIAAANGGPLRAQIATDGFWVQSHPKCHARAEMETTNRLWKGRMAGALLWVAATFQATAQPALPAFKSVAVDVDISGLPASEQAALVPLLRAARQMDAVYMRQLWPGTPALISERQSAGTPAAQAELDSLNFFKGPWTPTGTAFIGGVPSERPIGDFYPSGATRQDLDTWLATLSGSERKRALDPFTAVERGQDGALKWSRMVATTATP
jgi:hypothetical protein